MTRLVVHGGAGSISEARQEKRQPVLREAAREGHDLLAEGGTATEAVLRAVMVLEADPLFNAGVGSALTLDGRVEMDASIMSTRGVLGAVSELTRVRHPIRVAKLVAERTDHCFLTGSGLESFVSSLEIPRVDPVTEQRRDNWEEVRSSLRDAGYDVDRIPDPDVWGHCTSMVEDVRAQLPDDTETVGAVAVDREGETAAATSTGGKPFKLPGRVGDSPVAGAGTMVREAGGVSVTGDGEGILRMGVAHLVLDQLRTTGAREAARRIVDRADERGVECGLIVLDPENEQHGSAFNTDAMTTAAIPE
jgi:beta-aspartyl-peptidase (threonine type)